jgi:ubiquinone biosynthesis protein COQ9
MMEGRWAGRGPPGADVWDLLEHPQADMIKTWAAAARAYKVAAGKMPRVTPRYSEQMSQLVKVRLQADIDCMGNSVMEASCSGGQHHGDHSLIDQLRF